MGRTSIKSFIFATLLSGAWGLCFPSCNNSSGLLQDGSRVPNPSTCDEFYICSDPAGDGNLELSQEPLTCPTGQYFDRNTLDCEVIPNDGSSYCDACNPCEVECTEPGGVLPNPYSCDAYYVCLQNLETISATCGAGLSFDFESGECLPEGDARCFEACDVCTVYCVEEGRLPDPYDCHAYLYCEPGIGTTPFQCPEGDYYDAGEEACLPEGGSSCQSACSDSGSSGSPITTDSMATTGTSATTAGALYLI